jgi:hypothetical protein
VNEREEIEEIKEENMVESGSEEEEEAEERGDGVGEYSTRENDFSSGPGVEDGEEEGEG